MCLQFPCIESRHGMLTRRRRMIVLDEINERYKQATEQSTHAKRTHRFEGGGGGQCASRS